MALTVWTENIASRRTAPCHAAHSVNVPEDIYADFKLTKTLRFLGYIKNFSALRVKILETLILAILFLVWENSTCLAKMLCSLANTRYEPHFESMLDPRSVTLPQHWPNRGWMPSVYWVSLCDWLTWTRCYFTRICFLCRFTAVISSILRGGIITGSCSCVSSWSTTHWTLIISWPLTPTSINWKIILMV